MSSRACVLEVFPFQCSIIEVFTFLRVGAPRYILFHPVPGVSLMCRIGKNRCSATQSGLRPLREGGGSPSSTRCALWTVAYPGWVGWLFCSSDIGYCSRVYACAVRRYAKGREVVNLFWMRPMPPMHGGDLPGHPGRG